MHPSDWFTPKGHVELTACMPAGPWPTLEAFRLWYLANGMPMNMGLQQTVYRTDIASAVSLFRSGQFLVELYLIDRPELVDHAHPHVDLIQMFPTGVEDGQMRWHVNSILPAGRRHGTSDETTVPPVMLVFEQWRDGHEPTSVSVDWSGPILGPLHRDLIKRHSPQTRIVNGVAQ